MAKCGMKVPKRIQPLVEDGLVDEVVSQLMSGKEADVYIVRCGGAIRCAKVYKEANQRGFKQAALYQEGRKVRNSRRARAMEKARSSAVMSRNRPGRPPKWMHSIVWLVPACEFPSPTAVSMVCC